MIKSINEVEILEINGKDICRLPQAERPDPKLTVVSHWNYKEFVVLHHGETGEKITVNSNDLIAAITNAKNTNRHGM